ncbi:MAG TPA: CBS domain-containing protein [Deltaproteobacteria bacterium]|nr:CBS domain-containing protein [Deltaproteobacteria bacterium]
MRVSEVMIQDPWRVASTRPLAEGGRMLVQHQIRHLPVVGPEGSLIGLVTDADVFRHGAFLDIDRGWIAHEAAWDSLTCGEVATPAQVARPDEDLAVALQRLGQTRADALVVIDTHQRPIGVLTEVDVLALAPGVLDEKIGVDAEGSDQVHGIPTDAPAGQALWTMLEEEIRHVVITEGDRVVGVLSLRDLVGADVARRPELSVGEVLGDTQPITAPPGLGLLDAAMRMHACRIGCLPIVDRRRRVLRIVTRRDVLHAVVAHLDAARLFPSADPGMSHALVGAIVTTHSAVQRFLDQVRAEAEGADVDLSSELSWLSTILPPHFAHEETEGGFFDRLEAWLPAQREAIGRLRREHGALLEAVEALKVPDPPRLRERIGELAGALADHEARERQLSLLCEEVATD